MKISNLSLSLLFLLVISHSEVVSTASPDPQAIGDQPAPTEVATKVSLVLDSSAKSSIETAPKKQDFQQTMEVISDIITKEAYLTQPASKLDVYNLATNVFNSQKYLGDLCTRCKKLEYMAFRQGNLYLTAFFNDLRWVASSSPINSQLFIAQQQVDGTWAFKSLSQGKYMRADNNGVTINWQTFVGPWQRWYIQRHGSHVHIQSGQFAHFYWINSGPVLQQLNGGASMLIVEHWPNLNWLWN